MGVVSYAGEVQRKRKKKCGKKCTTRVLLCSVLSDIREGGAYVTSYDNAENFFPAKRGRKVVVFLLLVGVAWAKT